MKDQINPRHYLDGGMETIHYIKAKLSPEEFRGYIKGNVFKYLSRERGKGGDEDLAKAAWYLTYLLRGTRWFARCVDTGRADVGKRKKRSRKRRRPRDRLKEIP
jgi:hypothetical protein